ncbi:MAG: iron donor protein CyaY [Betaproteobacteria bacterium]|nr:iron donor protein CyaY [Betaproteobacteria bacterium]MBI2960632.1 iron donor protein CyaY [Betaproteobacteria bacterium]
MNESDFNAAADLALAALARALEASGAQCDCEFRGDGVLEIEFEDRGRIIVNRHSAAKEIWVAARSGGFHFRPSGGQWVNTRDGTEFFAALSRLISENGGGAVVLRPDY